MVKKLKTKVRRQQVEASVGAATATRLPGRLARRRAARDERRALPAEAAMPGKVMKRRKVKRTKASPSSLPPTSSSLQRTPSGIADSDPTRPSSLASSLQQAPSAATIDDNDAITQPRTRKLKKKTRKVLAADGSARWQLPPVDGGSAEGLWPPLLEPSFDVRSARSKAIQMRGLKKRVTAPVPSIVAALMFLGAENVEKALLKELSTNPPADALLAALHHCAKRGLSSSVRILLARGVPADGQLNKCTALQAAASHGHVGVCKILLDHGADPVGATVGTKTLLQFGDLMAKERSAILELLYGR